MQYLFIIYEKITGLLKMAAQLFLAPKSKIGGLTGCCALWLFPCSAKVPYWLIFSKAWAAASLTDRSLSSRAAFSGKTASVLPNSPKASAAAQRT